MNFHFYFDINLLLSSNHALPHIDSTEWKWAGGTAWPQNRRETKKKTHKSIYDKLSTRKSIIICAITLSVHSWLNAQWIWTSWARVFFVDCCFSLNFVLKIVQKKYYSCLLFLILLHFSLIIFCLFLSFALQIFVEQLRQSVASQHSTAKSRNEE